MNTNNVASPSSLARHPGSVLPRPRLRCRPATRSLNKSEGEDGDGRGITMFGMRRDRQRFGGWYGRRRSRQPHWLHRHLR